MKNYFFITILFFSVYFSQAQIVNIPDANFKNALVNTNCVDTNGDGEFDDDVDTNNDGEIQYTEVEVVSNLNVIGQEISSTTGIENFINLIKLRCSDNQLSEINLSQNIILEDFYCQGNLLSSLDTSQNTNLVTLYCGANLLSSLDITQNLFLENLNCQSNQLTNLDLTGNPNLITLECSFNLLTSIDITQNSNLYWLLCQNNLLDNLDLSNNQNLRDLLCFNNQLTSLSINNGNNQQMNNLFTWNNPNLTCIQVDDVDYANSQNCDDNNWCKDDWAVFSENCTLGIIDLDSFEINIYPNPVQNTLFINSETPIDSLQLYTLQGQLIDESQNNQIDVSTLTSGLYFVSVMIDGKNIVKKFIKN
jgi:Leucine-rich repeat (LRR) protein